LSSRTSVEVAIVRAGVREQLDPVTLEEGVGLLVAQLVEHAVRVVAARTELTPKMVIRRFPRSVAAGTEEPPPISFIFDPHNFLWRHHLTPTNGCIKDEILVRGLKVKLKQSESAGCRAITSVVGVLNTPGRLC